MENVKPETIEKVETVELPLDNQPKKENPTKPEPQVTVGGEEKKYTLSEIKEIISMFNINTNIVNETKEDKKEPENLKTGVKTKYEW
ncbi:MAG: hypothetical protein IKJ03_00955 [Mycoplasmataceae bacterium]|nr:hypothetical protein [Mycoplasmataceae bacterium]